MHPESREAQVVNNTSIWKPPEHPYTAPPDSVEVLVIGAGITGLSIAQRLHSQGAKVLVLEQKKHVAGGMATRGMGIASLLLLDPPFRLIQAVGLEVAQQITRFTRESVALWGPRIDPVGVGYLPKGDAETAEVETNRQAMTKLGFDTEAWKDHAFPLLGNGWHQPQGGAFDPETTMSDLAKDLQISTGHTVVAVEDQGFDMVTVTQAGVRVRSDLVVMTGGAQVTPWAKAKFHPVRHQALATEAMEKVIPFPIHCQYGYTSVRQTIQGQVVLSGCRWATPHLEVGETDDSTTNPAVHSKLHRFLTDHIPGTKNKEITHQWSGIMTFSCDGLPVIGPLPGRPRLISCGGFGAFSPSLSLRAAKAVVDGITTGESPGVPTCFSTQRFE